VRDRVITAVVLAAGLLAVLFLLPVEAGHAAFAVMVLAGAWEWSALAGARSTAARLGYVVATAALMLVCGWISPGPVSVWLPWLSLVAWIACFAFIVRYPIALPTGLAAVVGLIVLPAGWFFLARLHGDPDLGPPWVLALFLLVAFADIGAFFAGRKFGRRRLAPAVSPKKTWEGVLGGLAAAGAGGARAGVLFGRPLLAMLAVGFAVAAVSVIGDLTVSMFKRAVGLKDSGTLLPGHGGVLDRTDSLLAAAPLFFVAVGRLSGG
jgi:phosphatidate cytidylyltransferase